jgi:hypothetical protein
MLVALVCCVTAAGGRYLIQGLAGDTAGRASFVIAVLVLPMLLLIAVNLVRLTVGAWHRRRSPRRGHRKKGE